MRSLEVECQVLKSTQIDEIIDYYGFYVYEGYGYIFMELMDFDLAYMADKVKPYKMIFDERALSIIAVNILRAIDYLAESFGILHGDLKLKNILLKRSGEIKLCDFGSCYQFKQVPNCAFKFEYLYFLRKI